MRTKRSTDSGRHDSRLPNHDTQGGELRIDLTALPELGITGALVIVIAYLLTSNARDRAAHERSQQRREAEHSAELIAARAAHEAELAGLHSRLSQLEQRLTELESELDQERERRRLAEDDAAAARRRRL